MSTNLVNVQSQDLTDQPPFLKKSQHIPDKIVIWFSDARNSPTLNVIPFSFFFVCELVVMFAMKWSL
jgi:hypothetical protein